MYNRQNRSAMERAVKTLRIVREITPRILKNIALMYGISVKEIRGNYPNMKIIGSVEAVEYYEKNY